MEAVLNHPRFADVTHVLKADTDVILHPKAEALLHRCLSNLTREADYFGGQRIVFSNRANRRWHVKKVSKNDTVWRRPVEKSHFPEGYAWANGGCTYLLSRQAMRRMVSVWNHTNLQSLYRKEIYEDVAVARALHPDFHLKGELSDRHCYATAFLYANAKACFAH